MNASQPRETTMLPGARRLVQLTVKNGDKSAQMVQICFYPKKDHKTEKNGWKIKLSKCLKNLNNSL